MWEPQNLEVHHMGVSCNWYGKEVHNNWEDENWKDDKDNESLSGVNKEKEGDDVNTTVLDAIEIPPLTVEDKMQASFFRLLLSQT